MILAVDTTSEFGSVALRRGSATVAEVQMHSTDGFGHLLIQAIEEVRRRPMRGLKRLTALGGKRARVVHGCAGEFGIH